MNELYVSAQTCCISRSIAAQATFRVLDLVVDSFDVILHGPLVMCGVVAINACKIFGLARVMLRFHVTLQVVLQPRAIAALLTLELFDFFVDNPNVLLEVVQLCCGKAAIPAAKVSYVVMHSLDVTLEVGPAPCPVFATPAGQFLDLVVHSFDVTFECIVVRRAEVALFAREPLDLLVNPIHVLLQVSPVTIRVVYDHF